MSNKNWLIVILIVIIIMLVGYIPTQREKYYDSKEYHEKLTVPEPKDNDYDKVKSWDYEQQQWNYYNPVKVLSDEEIRILREKQSYKSDGSYIYTPGRHVPSREEEIEKYIDKHGEEIYEELHDKYKN